MNAALKLRDFLRRHPRIAVLTGAGISTLSGIPDYRDENGDWKHAKPMQFAEFKGALTGRQRYWARSIAGWQRIRSATPNAAHRALRSLEAAGRITQTITQNVDGLHSRAGSRRVIDLHGRLDRVVCIDCGWRQARHAWQSELERRNPTWNRAIQAIRPDGDAALDDDDSSRFAVPDCPACGGIVKPDVVFFGENVPAERIRRSLAAIDAADALLVIGSSLMVYSGFRLPRYAEQKSKPVAILNRGRTRADGLASLRLQADCAATLDAALARPGTPSAGKRRA